jgi:hypothetical protein
VIGIADYIRDEVFRARVHRSAVLVVYDPHRRYLELCLSLACDAVAVVDASEGSIESREAAVHAFVSLCRGESETFVNLYPFLPGAFRDTAAPAGSAGEIDRRHRPAFCDQSHTGHPDRG